MVRSGPSALLFLSLCSCSVLFSESSAGDAGSADEVDAEVVQAPDASCGPTTSGLCAMCASGADCGSGICDPREFTCKQVAEMVYIATDGDNINMCEFDAPCATVSRAAQVASMQGKRVIAFLDDDGNPASETLYTLAPLLISTAPQQGLTLIGNNVTIETTDDSVPLLTVLGGADVEVVGLHLRGSGGSGNENNHGASCRDVGSSLSLLDVTVSGSQNMGVFGENCALNILRSRIIDNHNTGLSAEGGEVQISHSLIAGNGHASSFAGAIRLQDDQVDINARIYFTTVTQNTAGSDVTDAAVRCVNLASPIAAAGNIVQTNIGTFEVYDDASGCVMEHSAIEGAISPQTGQSPTSTPLPVPMNPTTYELLDGANPAVDVDPLAGILGVLSERLYDLNGRLRLVGSAPDMGALERP